MVVGVGILWAVALVLAAVNVRWAVNYCRMLRQPMPPSPWQHRTAPRVAVILTLRGNDPYLADTLTSLLNQTYSNFQLRVVVDSVRDAAWETLNPFLDEGDPRLRVSVLTERRNTCTLKLSAICQEIDWLDDDVEIVVLVDADAVPEPEWLAQLVAPFANPDVGAVSGQRWFTPASDDFGTLVRSVWGAVAMVQMQACRIPWAGSLALSRQLFQRSDLLNWWANSFVDDPLVDRAAHQAGMTMKFVPVVLVNPEQIRLGDCLKFIQRQMLGVRLYHAAWPVVGGFALATGLLTLGSTLLVIAAMFSGSYGLALSALGAQLCYGICMGQTIRRVDAAIRRRCAQQGTHDLPTFQQKFIFALAAMGWLYPWCVFRTLTIRQLAWRGVKYDLLPGGKVRMLNDQPYLAHTRQLDASVV